MGCWKFYDPCSAFESMIHFMFSGNEKTVSSIKDLDLLFELYRLADKVMKLFSVLWIRIQNPNGVSNFVDPDQHSEYESRSFTIKFRYRKIKRKEISEISLHPIFSKNKKDFKKDFSENELFKICIQTWLCTVSSNRIKHDFRSVESGSKSWQNSRSLFWNHI